LRSRAVLSGPAPTSHHESPHLRPAQISFRIRLTVFPDEVINVLIAADAAPGDQK
jgi:hypothetical protein